MFIPAHELMGFTAGHTEGYNTDYLPLSESPSLYAQKLKESKENSASGYSRVEKGKDSLYQSIQKEGVRNPIELRIRKNDIQINDGHHRLIAAHDINPDMEVPVTYSSRELRTFKD
jgi:hypothetical protein